MHRSCTWSLTISESCIVTAHTVVINLHAKIIRNEFKACWSDQIKKNIFAHKIYLRCWKFYKFNDLLCSHFFFMSHCGSCPGKSCRPSTLLRPDSPLDHLYNGHLVSFPTVMRPWRYVYDLTYLSFIRLAATPQTISPYWLEHLSDISLSASDIVLQLKPVLFSATSIDLRGSVDVQLPRTIFSQSR